MRDFPTISALTLSSACSSILVNLLADLSYALLDPQDPALMAAAAAIRPGPLTRRPPAHASSGAQRRSGAGRAISLWVGVAIVGLVVLVSRCSRR